MNLEPKIFFLTEEEAREIGYAKDKVVKGYNLVEYLFLKQYNVITSIHLLF